MRKMLDLARRVLIATIGLGLLCGGGSGVAAAQTAMPHGGQVVQGQATIATPSASQMVITQGSQRAIVNWNGFSIGPGGRLLIKQPNAQAAILNRVTGGDLSRIDGQLQANGQVYLLNPHGIVVGPGGRVDTAAFLASVLHVSDHAFMAGGSLTFSGHSTAGILNLGTIHAALGDVALFGPAISNRGTIDAPNGTAALVSGSQILFAPGADSFYIKAPVVAADGQTPVDNSGVIKAAQVELKAAGSAYALAVNDSGVISATAVEHVGGRVILDAGTGDAAVSGTIAAQAGDNGGTVTINGGQIDVASSAAIRANAAAHGNGGSVTIVADGDTHFDGTIEAMGGPLGGDGGNAEVSGSTLWYAGLANLLAPHGRTGTLLFDPLVLDSSNIPALETLLSSANVTESAADSITVSSAIDDTSGAGNTLTLDAPTVAVNADITVKNGEIDFGHTGGTGTSLTSGSGVTLSTNLVQVLSGYNTVDLAGPLLLGSNGLGYSPTAGTPGSFTADNASNQIKNLYLTNNAVSLTGDVDVQSSVAMQVADKLTTSGKITLVATGGDLAFGGGGPTLNAGGTMKLASTNGAFNDNGSLTLGGAGRKIIYSSTDGGNFNVTGIGYTQYNPVSYPDDPQGSGNVIYIKTASGLPLLTITADDQSVVYGSSDPSYTASYSGGSTSDLTSSVLFQVSGSHANVGDYTITPYGATSTSHHLSFVNGTLTVTPASLVITAADASMTYGSTVPGFSATFSGLKNSDTTSVVSGLTFTTSATSSSNAGSYSIVPSGGSASNYTITYANGTLTVNPAVLTVTINDATRQYGAATPAFSSLFSGFVNGDSSSIVSGDLSYSTTATASSGVGTYAISGSGLSVPGNYHLEYVPGTLTITPAPLLVVTASESVVYGQPVATPQTGYRGLLLGDTPESLGLSVSPNVVPGTGVGTYSTILSGSSANYTITYTPGLITVTPAPLTITAGSFERTNAEPNPPLTVTVAGLFGNDQVKNLKVTTTAGENALPATYPITVTSDRMPNYDITYVNGTATVIPQPLIFSTTYTQYQNIGGLILSNNDKPVLVGTPILGDIPGAGAELENIVDDFVDAMKKGGDTTITSDGVLEALYNGNQTTHDEITGDLLPFIDLELQAALDTPVAQRTPGQTVLITAMEKYVYDQRVAAANTAEQEFADWQDAQNAKITKPVGTLAGASGLYVSAVESSTPEQPPLDFLQQAVAGLTLSSADVASYANVTVQADKMAQAAAEAANDSTTDSTSNGLAPNPRQAEAESTTDSTTKSAVNLNGIPGTLTDVGRAYMLMQGFQTTNTDSILLSDSLASKNVTRMVKKNETRAKVKQTMDDYDKRVNNLKNLAKETETTEGLETTTKAVDTTTKAVEGATEGVEAGLEIATKVMSVGSKVLAVGGEVLDIVGTAVQVGIGVGSYAAIAEYKSYLDLFSKTDRQTVTETTLKSMSGDALMTYLTAMVATRGQVAGQ